MKFAPQLLTKNQEVLDVIIENIDSYSLKVTCALLKNPIISGDDIIIIYNYISSISEYNNYVYEVLKDIIGNKNVSDHTLRKIISIYDDYDIVKCIFENRMDREEVIKDEFFSSETKILRFLNDYLELVPYLTSNLFDIVFDCYMNYYENEQEIILMFSKCENISSIAFNLIVDQIKYYDIKNTVSVIFNFLSNNSLTTQEVNSLWKVYRTLGKNNTCLEMRFLSHPNTDKSLRKYLSIV